MTHVTCRLTAKTRIRSGTLRSSIEYGLLFLVFGYVKEAYTPYAAADLLLLDKLFSCRYCGQRFSPMFQRNSMSPLPKMAEIKTTACIDAETAARSDTKVSEMRLFGSIL